MPTYAYACTSCEHRFEVRQSFSDSSLRECPECTGPVRKLFNSVGIVFKGSGFYRTDSRSAPGTGEKASGNGSSDKPAAASAPAGASGSNSRGSDSSGSAKAGTPAKAGSSTGTGSAA